MKNTLPPKPPTHPNVTPEMIEAGAIAIWEGETYHDTRWEFLRVKTQEIVRQQVQTILVAAELVREAGA